MIICWLNVPNENELYEEYNFTYTFLSGNHTGIGNNFTPISALVKTFVDNTIH